MTKDAKNVFDYSGKKKIWFLISLALIAVIIVVTIIKGVEVAIEFKGGTIISYSYEGDAQVTDVQKDIEDLLNTPVTIQEGENLASSSNSVSISFSYDQGLTADRIHLQNFFRKNFLTTSLRFLIQTM